MKLYVLFSVLATVLSEDIKCFDCEPSDNKECLNPVDNNVKSTVCKEAVSPFNLVKKQIFDFGIDVFPKSGAETDSPATYECFSMHFKTNKTELTSGVYRGCIPTKEYIASGCEYIKERLEGEVTCESCSSNECNKDLIGGAHALTVSLGVIILNLILCVKVFSF